MAYYNPKIFTSKADAVAAIEAANFKSTAVPDVFVRVARNIRSFVCVGQCRTGTWLIMAAPPVDIEVDWPTENAGRAFAEVWKAKVQS
jgi:hypothetical protein